MRARLTTLALALLFIPSSASARSDLPESETIRELEKAMELAIVSDSLCGTEYSKVVIANGRRDVKAFDELIGRDELLIGQRARLLIEQINEAKIKDKFCAKVARDARSAPDE